VPTRRLQLRILQRAEWLAKSSAGMNRPHI
jgi:hypothetical protein